MTHINLELPETVYSVLHCGPEELGDELRLAAAARSINKGESLKSGPLK